MCDMDVHGKQDFAAGKTTVRRIVRGIKLGVGEIRDHRGTVVERIAQEFYDGVFFGGRRKRGRLGIFQASTELVIRGGDVRHQLAEVHGFAMRTETVLVGRHGLRHLDRKTTKGREVLGIFASDIGSGAEPRRPGREKRKPKQQESNANENACGLLENVLPQNL